MKLSFDKVFDMDVDLSPAVDRCRQMLRTSRDSSRSLVQVSMGKATVNYFCTRDGGEGGEVRAKHADDVSTEQATKVVPKALRFGAQPYFKNNYDA